MKYSELEKILREQDCDFHHNGGNHPLWKSNLTGRIFPMSHHKNQEVRPGTLKSILTASGAKI
jgi:predicted RNA binding protein YcfA (HicA-like mRNA interferase family)